MVGESRGGPATDGGGDDTYVTARPEVKNDAVWHLAPLGSEADPANHKGIGVDK